MTGHKFLPGGAKSTLSVNGLALAGLPSLYGMDRFNGRSGGELCSWAAISACAGERLSGVLPQNKQKNNIELLKMLFLREGYRGRCLEILREIAERLSAILYVLHTGTRAARDHNPGISDVEWSYWRGLSTVYIAGYLVEGSFGAWMEHAVNHTLSGLGIHTLTAKAVACPVTPSLAGCARLASVSEGYSLVFDFGHTKIKRGIAAYDLEGVCGVRELMPTALEDTGVLSGSEGERAQAMHRLIVGTVADVYRIARSQGDAEICGAFVAIANNTVGGRIAARGRYEPLSLLGGDYRSHLSRAVEDLLGTRLDVVLVNDAAAAGLLFAGENAAVLTLGTGIGVAYPPAGGNYADVRSACLYRE